MEFVEGGAGALPELNEADFDHTAPRLEMRVVAEELLRRVPDYRLAPGAEIRMRTALVRGPLSLEVTWETA